jgi:hypothetical protein
MLQPVLTVWGVGSAVRAAIRAWIGATAMASMRVWLQAAEAAPTAVRHVSDLSRPGPRRRADRLYQRRPVQVHRRVTREDADYGGACASRQPRG